MSAIRGLSSTNRGQHGRTRGRPRGSRGRGRIQTRPGLPDSSLDAMGIPSSTSPVPSTPPGIRRGPGRPRLKPYGPSHQGSRRGKKSGSADTSPSTSDPGTSGYPIIISGSASSREIKEREFKAFDAFLH
ncbi:hypothetical protein B566_EDAN014973 [Ephemera danica]|nr:hypothetical protein B566_EDAN014973 [Ephemera danica]